MKELDVYRKKFNYIAEIDNKMRFFDENAAIISSLLNLSGCERILDVATGNGDVAIELARRLSNGHVLGIDFSEGMISQANKKKNELGLTNIEFIRMDMRSLDLPDRSFDIVVCSFCLFFVEDIKSQLFHIAQKVKKGGIVLVTSFFENCFSPPIDLFFKRLETHGIDSPIMIWKRLATKEGSVSLFKEVGIQDVKAGTIKDGFYLKDASVWWYIVLNAGFKNILNQLKPEVFKKIKEEHLAEINELATKEGVWLKMDILYLIGKI
ncbi:MAG: class I SAM-dependent methyltransferase [Candidatus Lokiarchaeota archaeon]|nr:class I SAM-dependent methyltransferase [Candidatus Lokiarchaeota archaeon]